MPLELDGRFTFENFVVGSGNRLAAAAARRVGDAPGTTYNPLFIYAASGLGKTHLIMAVGNHIRRVHPQRSVIYDTLEHLMDSVMSAIEAGDREAFRNVLRDVSVLLLDDVQFLAGRRSAQEELLRAWDGISARGGQLVLASDRPPTEIDDLDERLLSRFSGGLITDVDAPDYETRVAIVTKKAEERGQALASGVAETLAKVTYANVRELQGALTRVLAVQELDARSLSSVEVAKLLGIPAEAVDSNDEFGAFLDEIAGALGGVVARVTPEQRLLDAIERHEQEGFATTRLQAALGREETEETVAELMAGFDADVARLTEIAQEIRSLDPEGPELARLDVLRNPERVEEAEALLALVRERSAPLPTPPAGADFDALPLGAELLPVRAARAVAQQPGERYNPFFVHGDSADSNAALIGALARELQRRRPDLPLAYITGQRFSAELIAAIARNHVDAWRARYRRARVLVIEGVDALVGTERAQEELFHLYEAVRRGHGQLVFSAQVPPGELGGLENRLRSRLESGLVIELQPAPEGAAPTAADSAGGRERVGEPTPEPRRRAQIDALLLESDKVLWQWPHLEDTLLLELE